MKQKTFINNKVNIPAPVEHDKFLKQIYYELMDISNNL